VAIASPIISGLLALAVALYVRRLQVTEAARTRRADAYSKFLAAYSTHTTAMMNLAIEAGRRYSRQDIGQMLADATHPGLEDTSRAIAEAFYDVSFWAPDPVVDIAREAIRKVDPQEPFFLNVGKRLQSANTIGQARDAASDAATETIYPSLAGAVAAMQDDVNALGRARRPPSSKASTSVDPPFGPDPPVHARRP
jgi:hypothetical protein